MKILKDGSPRVQQHRRVCGRRGGPGARPGRPAPLGQDRLGRHAVPAAGGQGRGRTADLPIFSRTLVPTELPGRCPAGPSVGWASRTIPEPAGAHENGSHAPIPLCCAAFRPPSSSGPGPRPFTAVARVRIPLGVLQAVSRYRAPVRVSDQHRLLFVHVQKTGGNTVRAVFNAAAPDARNPLGELPKHAHLGGILKAEPGLAEYDVFGFVRNPWSRMVSWWSMIQDAKANAEAGNAGAVERLRTNRFMRLVATTYETFDDFAIRGPGEFPRLRTPQLRYLATPATAGGLHRPDRAPGHRPAGGVRPGRGRHRRGPEGQHQQRPPAVPGVLQRRCPAAHRRRVRRGHHGVRVRLLRPLRSWRARHSWVSGSSRSSSSGTTASRRLMVAYHSGTVVSVHVSSTS